uniref:Uncharacterized protein n=1 Tax=Arundo donax TaxID=35708 RepID=A0A0A9GLE8_ARUDO
MGVVYIVACTWWRPLISEEKFLFHKIITTVQVLQLAVNNRHTNSITRLQYYCYYLLPCF